MEEKNLQKIIKYWQKSAEHNYETFVYLFKGKRYADALFFGHITLEKILKAHVVKPAPKIHDLVRLAKLTKLNLNKNQLTYLKIVNRFNMRARYPDIKLNFYKYCTKEYTTKHYQKINKLYQELCQRLK